MVEQRYIVDKGIFTGNVLSFSIKESFDTVHNLLRTIKEYRDYTHPDSPSWEEYILELFHLLGFDTKKINQRTILLGSLGTRDADKAIAGITMPGESLDAIAPWLDWATFLSYPAKIHNVEWGILTDGINIKIFQFSRKEYIDKYFHVNLDAIIQEERMDSFFILFKVFLHIKGQTSGATTTKVIQQKPIQSAAPNASSPLPSVVDIEKQIHTPQQAVEKTRLPGTLESIFEVIKEMLKTGHEFDQVCEDVAKRRGVKVTTIRISCTRQIFLKPEAFIKLLEDKTKLISYLHQRFPGCKPEITNEIEQYY